LNTQTEPLIFKPIYLRLHLDKVIDLMYNIWVNLRGVAQLVARLLWERKQVTPLRKIKSAKKPLFMHLFGTLQNLKNA